MNSVWYLASGILESANTVGTFVVDIPVTNTVVNRINAIAVWLWRLVLFARFVNTSGLSRLILSYVVEFCVFVFDCLIDCLNLASINQQYLAWS